MTELVVEYVKQTYDGACMGTSIFKVFQQCTWIRRSCSLCHLMPTLSSNSSMKFKNFPTGNSLDYLLTLADKRHGWGVTVVQTVVWTVVRLPYFCFFKLSAHQLAGRWPSWFNGLASYDQDN